MSITVFKRNELIKKYSRHDGDTGSPEVQVAILTERIKNLTAHMGNNKKDFHTRRGLLMLVGNRRKLLEYLKKNDETKYLEIIKELGLRK
ncbi:MAG: 30S ribosomal protein S15 [Holosporales bacterium]|jgi:small subunit ribosomal protein S15|nr:30S ribosomal protein S15 [Holosporales bacterium]